MSELAYIGRYIDTIDRTDDLISRADAIEAVERAVTKEVARWAIKELPSAQPKQGEWVAKTENYHSHWVCSICGGWALLEYNEQMCLSNYCPNCGARMTERRE